MMENELKKYLEQYNNDASSIEITKELAEQWLEDKIVTANKVNEILAEHCFPLCGGELNDGEYDVDIRMCSFLQIEMIHIYSGLRDLADILGKSEDIVKTARGDDTQYPYQIAFNYKGYTLFEIGGKDL